MQPTLANKARFPYDMAYYRLPQKRRGDVVVFHYRDSLFIKRIAAGGGDTIEGNGQQILLSGQPLNHTSATQSFGPVTFLSGKYFVLGDNLDMSLDSRTPSFGLVDENSIVGKALYSYQFTNTPLSRKLDQGRQGRNDE